MQGLAKIFDAVDPSSVFLARFWRFRTFPFSYLRFFIESDPIAHGQLPMDSVVNISFAVGASKYTCNSRLIIAFRRTLICRVPDKIYSVERRSAIRLHLYDPFIVSIEFMKHAKYFCNHIEGFRDDPKTWHPNAINLSKDGIGLRFDNLKRSFVPFLGQDFPGVKLHIRSPNLPNVPPMEVDLRLKNVAVREEAPLNDGDIQLVKNRFAYCGFQFIKKEQGTDEAIEEFIKEIEGIKDNQRGAA